MVSTDYLGRSIVSLVTVRQLSNAFRLSAYLVTLRMTRVLEFPRANNRNGIQTLRIIRVRKLIRTTDSIVYRPPILIPTQISSSREKYSEWIFRGWETVHRLSLQLDRYLSKNSLGRPSFILGTVAHRR